MRLLIVTQKVNKDDPILGFFHRWIEEFSKHVEQLTVICLEEGNHALSQNVRVFSLGKEKGVSRLKYLLRFFSYIIKYRNEYDAVFVHMNPIYVVLGGVLWKLFGKKTGLWYTHKHVDLKLRIAEKVCNVIFTASKESFRLESRKLKVMGHGIDTDIFHPQDSHNSFKSEIKRVVTSGRISPTKNIHIMIEAFALAKYDKAEFIIVGDPGSETEREYKNELQELVQSLRIEDKVIFVGNKSQQKVAEILQTADIFLNLSGTGSLDKAVLEAMASGVCVITSNEAFRNSADIYLPKIDVSRIASAISHAFEEGRKGNKRGYIESEHNIENLITRLVKTYE